jgi:prolyl-tRNA editing enzyme YbaK/EbsC (Cys-tRNA(Pro) deacylase)
LPFTQFSKAFDSALSQVVELRFEIYDFNFEKVKTLDPVLSNSSVQRIIKKLEELGLPGKVRTLTESARTAAEAATALGVTAGQIASSIVFKLPDGSPLLVITSGSHRVNTELVAKNLGLPKLDRADADFIKEVSGISIGGVSPFGWITVPTILIDSALKNYDVVWAAAGHAHAVFPTNFDELVKYTGGQPMTIAID